MQVIAKTSTGEVILFVEDGITITESTDPTGLVIGNLTDATIDVNDYTIYNVEDADLEEKSTGFFFDGTTWTAPAGPDVDPDA